MRSRSGVRHRAARASTVLGSFTSRRWAMWESATCWATRNTTASTASPSRPMRAVSSCASGMPLATWPCPLPFPMSCKSMPSIKRSGRSTSLSTCAMPSEEAELVHLAQRLRHPPPVAADVEEEIAHLGGAPEAVVHEVERLLHRPLHVHPQLEAQAMRVPEHLHEPARLCTEVAAVRVHEVDALVHDHQAVGQRLLAQPAEHGAAPGERLLAAGDEPARHAVDDAGVEVVVPHELLDVEGNLVALVAEALGDLRLDVAREHVVLVAGEEVELVAHPPQEGEGGIGETLLAPRDQPL